MRLFQRKGSSILGLDPGVVPADKLCVEDAAPSLLCTSGYPRGADCVAYSSVQRLLAVATSDGAVKVLGGPGVDAHILTGSQSPTVALQFIPFTGTLLRLTQDGDVQLLGLEARREVACLRRPDRVTCVATFAVEPYVLLGCASGSLHVGVLTGTGGSPAAGSEPVSGARLAPYFVAAEQLHAVGAIAALSLAPGGEAVAWADQAGGLGVWNLRRERLECYAAATSAALAGVGAAATACWVGVDTFATGHANGHVLVWRIPAAGAAAAGLPPQPQLLLSARNVPEGRPAASVRGLHFLSGSGTPRLLVFGGQGPEEPQMLTLFSLEQALAAEPGSEPAALTGGMTLHWFGTVEGWAPVAPLSDPADASAATAVVVLTEGGQLMVHDLDTLVPTPLELPLQELGPVKVSCWADACPPAAAKQHSLAAAPLRALAAVAPPSRGSSAQWDWVLSGGAPAAALEGDVSVVPLFFSGHSDGRVVVWDLSTQSPTLLATAAPPPSSRQPAPVVLQVCVASGLVAVARQSGATDLYQFNPQQRHVSVHTCAAGGGEPGVTSGRQAAGLQHVLRVLAPGSAGVACLALAARHALLAVGDDAGGVTLVDLAKPACLSTVSTGLGPLAALALSYALVPTAEKRRGVELRKSMDSASGHSGSPRLVLAVAAQDSSLLTLDVGRAVALGKPLRPKTASPATLALAMLDAEGSPAGPLTRHVVLPWAGTAHEPDSTGDEGAAAAEGGEGVGGAAAVEAAPGPAEAGAEAVEPSPFAAPAAQRVEAVEGGSAAEEDGAAEGAGAEAGGTDGEAVEGEGGGREGKELAGDGLHAVLSPAPAAGALPHAGSAFPDAEAQAGSRQASVDADGLANGLAAVAVDMPAGGAVTAASQDTPATAAAEAPGSASLPPASPRAPALPPLCTTASDAGSIPPLSASASLPPAALEPAGSGVRGGAAELSPAQSAAVGGSGRLGSARLRASAKGRVASLQAFYGTDAQGADAVSPTASDAPTASFSAAADPWDDLDDADSPALAAYVLAVTEQYMRLYPFDHVRCGDRTALAKVTFGAPLAAAAVFRAEAGPGAVAMGRRGELAVHSLPSMACLHQSTVDAIVGGGGASSGDASWQHALPSAAVAPSTGQVAVSGPAQEFVRIALLADQPAPAAPACLVDWTLEAAACAALQARAALATAAAAAAAATSRSASVQLEPVAPERAASVAAPPAEAQSAGSGGSGSGSGRGGKKSLTGFLSSVVTKVVDAGSEVADTLGRGATIAAAGVQGLVAREERGGSGGNAARERAPPTLAEVFERAPRAPAPPPAAASMPMPARVGAVEDRQALLGGSSVQAPRAGAGAAVGAGGGGVDLERVAAASRAAGPDGKPRARTAEEIRAAYGIKQKKEQTEGLKGMMAENMDLLAQRGEKLRNMEDRTAEMQESAAGFAEAARKLAQQETGKKWWQM